MLYGLLYKPLPFADTTRLVELDSRVLGSDFNVGVSPPYFAELARAARSLDNIAAYRLDTASIQDDDGSAPTSLEITRMQAGVYGMLGAHALTGRLPNADDEVRGAAPIAAVSETYARARFGSPGAALDTTLMLDGMRYRVVGVLADDFAFPSRANRIWLPLTFNTDELAVANAGSFSGLIALARLAPGVSATAADAEVRAIGIAMPEMRDAFEAAHLEIHALPLRTLWTGTRRTGLEMMLLAAALGFLVTVANVCNLALARCITRGREDALLSALGAGRWTRVRLATAEALILVVAAVALGLALLPAGVALLQALEYVPADTPQAIGVDLSSIVAALALAAISAPAIVVCNLGVDRSGLAQALKRGGAGHTANRDAQRARAGLIVTQIAIATALLVGVGLLLRSSQRLLREDVGFEREHLIYGPLAGGPPERATERRDALLAFRDRVRALPGVEVASLASSAPFGDNMNVGAYSPPGIATALPSATAYEALVDADYFAALGARPTRGRTFSAEEVHGGMPVALVDEHFVALHLAGADPIGREFLIGESGKAGGKRLTIVGVMPTMKRHALDEPGDYPFIYLAGDAPERPVLLVRTGAKPDTLLKQLGEESRSISPDGAASLFATMGQRIADTVRDRERINRLLELLGVFTLALAVVGLYAVLAYDVRSRAAEFGVRMALGADSHRIVRGVLGHGCALVAAGCLLGFPIAYAIARLLAGRLYRVGPFDLPAFTGVCALLAGVGIVASWLAAQHATAIQPIRALRGD